MNKTGNVIAFVLGAAIGSFVTWKVIDRKYEKLIQEEIESVKNTFSANAREATPINDVVEEYPEPVDIRGDFDDMVQDLGYTETPRKPDAKPYVIPPDQFGEDEEYTQVSLTYYADQVLADENDEIVEDVEGLIGFESLSHFGEYEDDSVFVRDDKLKCDYEILADQREYSDVIKKKPYLASKDEDNDET